MEEIEIESKKENRRKGTKRTKGTKTTKRRKAKILIDDEYEEPRNTKEQEPVVEQEPIDEELLGTMTECTTNGVKFSRVWEMPSPETFSIKCVSNLLKRYIKEGDVVIDPFARNSKFGTITNDINPRTSATHHLHAVKFLELMVEQGVCADVVLFDPPYSPRQISECYQDIGKKVTQTDTQNAVLNKDCKILFQKLLKKNGIAICFSWNSGGVGKTRGFQLVEIMMIAHGGVHNDTIVTVERRIK